MPTFNVEAARKDGLDEATIQQMIQATGATPSTRMATPLERARLSFGDARGREQFIQQRGLATDAAGNLLQPKGFDLGDVTSKAGGLLPLLGGIGGMSAALPAAAAVGVTGVGLPVAAGIEAAGGAAGAGIGEITRQGIGELLGVRKNTTGAESTQDLKTEGALGATSAIGGRLLGIAGKPLLSAAGKSMRNALNPAPKAAEYLSEKVFGTGRTYFEEFAHQGYKGTLGMMKNQAKTVINRTKPLVDKYIDTNAKKVVGDALELLSPLQKMADSRTDKASIAAINSVADSIIDKLARIGKRSDDKLTLRAADELRKSIDKETADLYFGVKDMVPAKKEAYKAVADVLRSKINDALPAFERGLRQEEHVARRLLTAATKRQFKKGALGVVTRSVLGGVGGAVGATAGFQVMGIPGATLGGSLGGTAALLAGKGLASTPSRTGLASLLKVSSKALEKTPANVRSAILDLVLHSNR